MRKLKSGALVMCGALLIVMIVRVASAQSSRSARRKSSGNGLQSARFDARRDAGLLPPQQQQQQQGRRARPDALQKRRRKGQRNEYDLRQLPDSAHPFQRFVESAPNGGLFPKPFNIAARAKITANATCGGDDEEFCRMADIYSPRQQSKCELCDASDPELSHPIENAVDGTHSFWQSPSLATGNEFEFVTIDIDLGQIYEIYSIKIKSAESPLPKAWILERSMDGVNYEPWQYFASSDADCLLRYQRPGQNSNYTLQANDEIICTTQYAESIRLKYGEAKFVVMAQREPVDASNFSLAHHIRLRFQGVVKDLDEIVNERTPKWEPDEDDLLKRSYYSIQSIMVIGRCHCSGHAAKCRENENDPNTLPQCECMHNTCGRNCDRCCPLFNQRPFRVGTPQKENKCEKCQCHDHASECRYSAEIEEQSLSVNVKGKVNGGGVCVNCTKFTTGINCEKCVSGYFRPHDRAPDEEEPCVPCACSGRGSVGTCNPVGGECVCKPGFSGRECNTCAVGFGGKDCEKCTCDVRGTIASGECDDDACQCKAHVTGVKCDRCKPGFFALGLENPDGCLKCVCSGLNTTCEGHAVQRTITETLEGWTVTDLSKTQTAQPVRDNDTGFYVFGMYELAEVEAVYWSAPEVYLGNHLQSYGSNFVFHMDYVIVRGDTSGKPTRGPNFIIMGRNGMKIAHGDGIFTNTNASVNVPLMETDWYHVPKSVKDVITRLKRTDYRGDPVTRPQFLAVLSDIESVLVRGTYHTDQAEAILKRATLYTGDSTTSNEVLEASEESGESLVERCHCPPGYTGLSCESCMFGHISVMENSSTHEKILKCLPCDCNGHSETCDVVTNACGECTHNTTGARCERCLAGFYGDAKRGTPDDCRPCACPLTIDSNNFSDECKLADDGDYVCLNCPLGHGGAHCEVCDEGYYGNPIEIDSMCVKCACEADEACDKITGKCTKCERNTEGWRCERCKKGFFGDPNEGCEPCECSDFGALNNVCDLVTGRCACKQNYTGAKCDRCEAGFVNVSLTCMACECNRNGSRDQLCDANSGQCSCKPNVHGLKCDECDELYFGLNYDGCEGCNCHVSGSEDRACNTKTGQCKCRPNVIGRTCDRCELGHWNIDSKRGCEECACNVDGSEHESCDLYSGACVCKPGVEGAKCDRCKGGYFGFSSNGCKKCSICDSASKICDQESGRCVCPPLSHGTECQHCYPNAWGWESLRGCKNCECNQIGSLKQTCDVATGQCECKEGYAGRVCDYCAAGYHGYPNCQKCNCDARGARGPECDERGQCPCKELVTGLKCDECRQATFGLSSFNPHGCTRCFCFGRSQTCAQNDLIWAQVRLMGPRNITVNYLSDYHTRYYNEDIDYIILSHTKNGHVYRETARYKEHNGLLVMPGHSGDIIIGTRRAFHSPLYVDLPKEFRGDKTSSYGGFLNFTLRTFDYRTNFHHEHLRTFPLVQLHTHYHLTLNYYFSEANNDIDSFNVVLHESYWRHATNGYNISRAIMMTALQNVKHVFVRITTSQDFVTVTLENATMSVGMPRNGNNNAAMASGIEKCECPEIYAGDSCQDPTGGFYRWRNTTTSTNLLEDLVGRVVPCECNGRSDQCDRETGECTDCLYNTGGFHCEECAEGFYGHPNDADGCRACPCPETNKKFARGCFVDREGVSCFCKEGYAGPLCEKCAKGFFGQPQEPDGKCESCDCNIEGIVSDECDYLNGQCNCKQGVIGRRCDKCELPRHLLIDYECQLCDNCTQTLLDTVDEMIYQFQENVDGIDLHNLKAPWHTLDALINATDHYSNEFDDFFHAVDAVDNFNDVASDELLLRSETLLNKANRLTSTADKRTQQLEKLKVDANEVLVESRDLSGSIQETILVLENYGSGDHHVKLPSAIKEARMYHDDVVKRAENSPLNNSLVKCASDQLEFWTDELKSTKAQRERLEKFLSDQRIFHERLGDLKNLTHRVFRDSSETEAFITKNRKDFERLKERVARLNEEQEGVDEILEENVVAQSASLMDSLDDSIEKAKATNYDLLSLHDEVERMIQERKVGLEKVREKDVGEARRHAESLAERSRVNVNLFQHSKDDAQEAVKAVTAYSNIIEAINAAREAADKAHSAAVFSNDKLNPADPDEETIMERAKDLSDESADIQRDAEQQIEKIRELKVLLSEQQDLVKNMSATIHKSGKINNDMSAQITKLSNSESRKSVQESANLIDSVLESVRITDRDVNEVSENVAVLREKLSELDPEWDTKFGLAEENIAKSLINIREANKILNTNEQRIGQQQEKFKVMNGTLSARLQELRDKITKAKHAAESIRISLESNDDSCVRSFFPPLAGVTTSNQIVMTFALNSRSNINSPLIFIQGEQKRFIALEMIKRKIYLLWNMGGDSGVVVHPLEILTRDPKYDDAWYKVEVTRNLNLASVSVSRMANNGSFLTTHAPVDGATSLNHTRFSITPNSRIYIGGVPDTLRPPEMKSANGLSIIVHQVAIDNAQIGLWHFASSEGSCDGAMTGPTESLDSSNSRHFNGYGYSVVHSISSRPYPKKLFSLQMTFKTLDENALLFLTVDEKNNRSISLTLHEGKLVFRIDYGDESLLEINTTNRFNTGEWVNVEAAREFTPRRNTENGSLKVNNEEAQTGSPSKPITNAMLPEVSKAPFYIGGVPPGFVSGTTKAPGADHAFFGCMRDVQINGEYFDPFESQNYYGIEPTCKSAIAKVGFYGNGYLELASHTLRKRANFAFVFRTLQSECVLLFSGFPPQTLEEFDEKDSRGNFSVTLVNGRVHVWIASEKGAIQLESNVTVNDGEFHVVNVNKFGRRFELRIDDNLDVTRSLPASKALISSPEEHGGLFFGGVPDFPEFDNLMPTMNGLRGAIKDVLFNNRTISFDSPISFTNVKFGALGPAMGSAFEQETRTEPIGAKFKEIKEGCQRVGSYSYESNAFKFGNSPYSYSMIQVPPRPIWHRNLNIQFDFRTFYPDGFLFAVPDSRDKPKHYVYLYLRNGNVVLTLRGRKREEISIPIKSNNGQWHHVTLDNKSRALTLTVSSNGKNKNESQKSLKVPKKFFASNIFLIGGLPPSVPTLHREVVAKKEDFKGCIRRFVVNGLTQDLTRQFNNLGQCFPRIEKGSYFSGDAYAEYKKEFNVGKHLEIEMEFKTSELNGILLSIAEPSGSPSLSIEISDGNLIMSCDFNNGAILRAEAKLSSKYSICDNKWHNVSAFYDTHQIAVRIDAKESVVASSNANAGKLQTRSPLFIGGIPESSTPRSIIMRENFKGCIRNVKLNAGYNGLEIVDWIDMDRLHNVLLNECPR